MSEYIWTAEDYRTVIVGLETELAAGRIKSGRDLKLATDIMAFFKYKHFLTRPMQVAARKLYGRLLSELDLNTL